MIKRGKLGLNGTFAYVPQQAWIFHSSVRENITFGAAWDEEKYNKGKIMYAENDACLLQSAGQHSSEEMSHQGRAVVNTASDLTCPGIDAQTSRTDSIVFTTELNGQSMIC